MKRCEDCRWCGMDMDLEPYCAQPEVLKRWPHGHNVLYERGARYRGQENDPAPLCGADAVLFEEARL